MRHQHHVIFLVIMGAFVLAGCQNDDEVTNPAGSTAALAGVVHGDIASDATTFEFTSRVHPDLADPPPGPFLIRGQVQGYDAGLGALVVDLTVVNSSRHAYPEPVTMTFMQLLPPGTAVLEADNGESGAGASYRLTFVDDDAIWSAGEASQPRTVKFVVGAGVSIGFAARVDVGLDPLGGAIGGLVWRDADADGVVDAGEAGIGGIGVRVQNNDDQHWVVTTSDDGVYRLDGLPAGYYSVSRPARPELEPTTPPQLQVVLVERDGTVSDFLAADFGCRVTGPADPIEVGDCLHVEGEYAAAPDRLVAAHYGLCGRDEDDGDRDKDHSCWDRLTGPVTDVDPARDAVAIMGTWLQNADRHFDLRDVAVLDRLQAGVVVVADEADSHLEACRLHSFNGHFDRIRGEIEAVVRDDAGRLTGVRILGTLVELTVAARDDDH
jgi:hypothetical protein